MEQQVKKGRAIRSAKVTTISDRLKNSKSIVINDYRGLTVEEISQLRREIAKYDANLHVQKNTLMKIALAEEGYPEEINEFLQGPSAIAYSNGDVSALLKSLFVFSKQGKLVVKGAFSDGVVMNANIAEKISTLPSKDQLIGQLMGVMQAPVRYLAVGLNDITARLARVLQAVADKKK